MENYFVVQLQDNFGKWKGVSFQDPRNRPESGLFWNNYATCSSSQSTAHRNYRQYIFLAATYLLFHLCNHTLFSKFQWSLDLYNHYVFSNVYLYLIFIYISLSKYSNTIFIQYFLMCISRKFTPFFLEIWCKWNLTQGLGRSGCSICAC